MSSIFTDEEWAVIEDMAKQLKIANRLKAIELKNTVGPLYKKDLNEILKEVS